ncbi:MAG TPA: aldehyde dehydrogenase family protein [Mycobacteriales bacterium]|nr:aldehyde dehydrogenase family protein [Mycobacteriales bacterium]
MTLLETISVDQPPEYGILLAGEPVGGGGPTLELTSRQNAAVIGRVASASAADVTTAFDRASAALPAWKAMLPSERAGILQRAATLFRERAEEIGAIISDEMGKPRGEAATEVGKGAAILDYFAQAPYRKTGDAWLTDTGEDVFTIVEPLGVVALITPWNFPFTLPMRKIAAALSTGNTVLFKPATNAGLCGLAIGRTLADAGLPDGVMSVILGQSSVIQEALFRDPRLGGVSLTGSYPTAEVIRQLLPVEVPFQAELGGKNALVVWADADLDLATDVVWASSFRNNGQICTSCGRLLVHESIAPRLLDRLRERIDSAPAGEYGILSSTSEFDKIRDTIARNRDQVSEVVDADWGDGRMSPTLLVNPAGGELIEEEIFGPVITIETVGSIEEAIDQANATAYGLTAGIVTNDLEVAKTFWSRANAGLVKVNVPLTGTPFHIPLRGWGHSGVGPGEGGEVSLDFFTKKKAVYLRRPTA